MTLDPKNLPVQLPPSKAEAGLAIIVRANGGQIFISDAQLAQIIEEEGVLGSTDVAGGTVFTYTRTK